MKTFKKDIKVNMQIIAKNLLDSSDAEKLKSYTSDLKDSLNKSNKQFISLQFWFLISIIFYHLTIYNGWNNISLKGFKIEDKLLFEQYFLVIPAGLFLMSASIGFLRKAQRELYDWLMVQDFNVSAKTGVHELRLSPDYILGLFVYGQFSNFTGKIISQVSGYIFMIIFIVMPMLYTLVEAFQNVQQFNYSLGSIIVSTIISLSFLFGWTIIFDSLKIK